MDAEPQGWGGPGVWIENYEKKEQNPKLNSLYNQEVTSWMCNRLIFFMLFFLVLGNFS